jgi:hypothetical protein
MYQWPEWAEEGGLIGYGPRVVQLFRDVLSRQLAALLRGAKPADIPVEQPTRFELVINLKAAKAIGHEVPAGLVLRADKVIEWGCFLLHCMSPLLAQSGHVESSSRCPLSGVKRTWLGERVRSAVDPKRTKVGLKCRSAVVYRVLAFHCRVV